VLFRLWNGDLALVVINFGQSFLGNTFPYVSQSDCFEELKSIIVFFMRLKVESLLSVGDPVARGLSAKLLICGKFYSAAWRWGRNHLLKSKNSAFQVKAS
jgi:hypothetical protein